MTVLFVPVVTSSPAPVPPTVLSAAMHGEANAKRRAPNAGAIFMRVFIACSLAYWTHSISTHPSAPSAETLVPCSPPPPPPPQPPPALAAPIPFPPPFPPPPMVELPPAPPP